VKIYSCLYFYILKGDFGKTTDSWGFTLGFKCEWYSQNFVVCMWPTWFA